MNDSNNSSQPKTSDLIDKEYLYGEFRKSDRKRQRYLDRLAHMAVDLPHDDDVQIHANRSTSGMGWKELAIVVLGLVSAAALTLWAVPQFTPPPAAPTQSAAPDPPASPPEASARIRVFWGDTEIQPGSPASVTVQ